MSNEKTFFFLDLGSTFASPKVADMAMRYVSPTELKKLRQDKKLTQSQMGQQIGVTKAAVSAYELGKSTPSDAVLAKIAQAFDLSIDFFTPQLVAPALQVPEPGRVSNNCRMVPLVAAAQQAAFALSLAPRATPGPPLTPIMVPEVPFSADFANPLVIELPDEAMSPTLRAGTRLLVTPVASAEWPYMPSGIYCLVYRSTFIVRRVKDNDLLEKNRLLLYADNSAGGMHPVRGEDLRAVWRVRWAVYAPVS